MVNDWIIRLGYTFINNLFRISYEKEQAWLMIGLFVWDILLSTICLGYLMKKSRLLVNDWIIRLGYTFINNLFRISYEKEQAFLQKLLDETMLTARILSMMMRKVMQRKTN
ncbi:hypothetical protein QE152_g37001 [Popillia japonica]|uniref:Uncharacterized protein n=1 Tax=Popillia japonica TaxID=7064 RepID=A0AAW1IBW1_POPJA